MNNTLKQILASVSKPGRYTGGEFGACVKKEENQLSIALSFPDLYEIGMSNVAIKILYNMLNGLDGVACERVFAPAPDMEEELRQREFPLFSLETGRPLGGFDLVAFSVGYELSLTNILNILELGQIDYRRSRRDVTAPIVLAGGPVLANPLPFGRFIDFAYIGEGEDFILSVIPRLAALKQAGASRGDLREVIRNHPAIWDPDDPGKTVRKAVFRGFARETYNTYLPVPNIKVIQDHGNVELMRGCPNGCRFCHAGMLYRPVRQKDALLIDREIGEQIFQAGYREITLASLSTGDYRNIAPLVQRLTAKYAPLGVSFALPSLRINSLSLDILDNISSVRKSGLTFAVETPEEDWQRGLNKEVSREKIIRLLLNAKKRGWRLAKFYFMLGLPLYEIDEVPGILDFILAIKQETRLKLNINVSTFVPKPHTPFQWAGQLEEAEALRRIQALRAGLQGMGFKLGYHSPAASRIEGLIARGDESAGEIVEEAFRRGARLDAWEEHFNRLLWEEVLAARETDRVKAIFRSKPLTAALPWDRIDIGVSREYLTREWERAQQHTLASPCAPRCPDYCGACRPAENLRTEMPESDLPAAPPQPRPENPPGQKLLISYSKQGKSIYLSHLNCLGIFERAFLRAGFQLKFTEGFNPKPRMEFAHPLSLGIASREEIMSIEVYNLDTPEDFISRVTAALPAGFSLKRVKRLAPYIPGQKKISLASLFLGAEYEVTAPPAPEYISTLYEKIRQLQSTAAAPEPLVRFSLEESSLFITWRQIAKKGSNILSFLEQLTGKNPFRAGLEICRIRLLAGHQRQQTTSYFDLVR